MSNNTPALRPYQQEDLNFLLKLSRAGIFSEQRTGKTPLAISYARAKNVDRTLILCPASAIPVWTSLWSIWYPEQTCIACTGYSWKDKAAKILEWKEKGQAMAISYDTLKATKRRKGFIDEIKFACGATNGNPDLVIIDEAHRIQARTAATTSAVYEFIKTPLRLALTGTPATNKPYQIWSILRFLYPKTFTSYWAYVDEFYTRHNEVNHNTGQQYTLIDDFKDEEAKIKHAEMLSKISVQRKRKEVMKWLPEKEYTRIMLEPTITQREALKSLHNYYEVGEIEVQGILDSLLRERQICLHPRLLGLVSGSPKTDWVIEYLKDYPERKVLIFSKFTAYLELLTDILHKELPRKEFRVFTGKTTITNRAKYVEEFQSGKINLMLCNLDAAKEAITLDTAEVAIFTDKFPPIGSIQQAEDRFVATTEDKKTKQHSIIELCMRKTYDQDIYELLAHNKEITDVVNDYKNYIKKEQQK